MTGRDLARRVGPVGVWTNATGTAPAAAARGVAAEIEQLGYGAIWIGETPRYAREAFTHAGLLLGATTRIVVGTGVANIWLRQPGAAAASAGTLGEAYDNRFVLGLGVSHAPALALVGQTYGKPLTAMRSYLQALGENTYAGPGADSPAPVVLAALQPRMQELAAEHTLGVHSFFVPPTHTARTRERIGTEPVLIPEQAVLVETDPDRARRKARAHVASRLYLPNYVSHLRAIGFGDADLADNGSDRLVDTMVAWGTEETVAARIREHLDAGADHVAVHPLESHADPVGRQQLADLATQLLGSQANSSMDVARPRNPTVTGPAPQLQT